MMSGGHPDISEAEYHALDKTWSEIHEMLQPMGYPLNLTITGDSLLPEANQTYEAFLEGEDDYYVGLMTVDLVRDIAALLERIHEPSMPEVGEPQTSDGHAYIDYVGPYFQELQRTYRDAASRGNALMIVIA